LTPPAKDVPAFQAWGMVREARRAGTSYAGVEGPFQAWGLVQQAQRADTTSAGVEGPGPDSVLEFIGPKGRYTNFAYLQSAVENHKMSTHQQLLYHIVFSTKNRQRLLIDGFREDVFAYMAGTAKELNGFAIKVGGFYDHVHLLVRIPAKVAVADFTGQLKANTSKHINDTSGRIRKFGWQDGYGAFTVSLSTKDRVVAYIENQMEHHRTQTFEEEYLSFLAKHEVEYNPRYVFD
jgi:REP element-mobilizing transposase RayT